MHWSFRDPLTISITILVVIVTLLAGASSKCLAGWSHYAKDNTCMKFFHNDVTWQNAYLRCRKLRSMLIQIWDLKKDKYIQGYFLSGNPYWIGINDENGDGKFEYINGSKLVEMDVWASTPGNGKCVASELTSQGWKKLDCEEKHGYVCEEHLNCGHLDSCPVITVRDKTYDKHELLTIEKDANFAMQCDLTGKTDDVVEVRVGCANIAFKSKGNESVEKTFYISGQMHMLECYCDGIHQIGTKDRTSVIINFKGGTHLTHEQSNDKTHCDPNKQDDSFSHKLEIYSNPRPMVFYLHKDDEMVKYSLYDLEFFNIGGIKYEVTVDVQGVTWSTKTSFKLFIGDDYDEEMTYTFRIKDGPCLVIPENIDPKDPDDGDKAVEGSYTWLWILLIMLLILVGAFVQWRVRKKEGDVGGAEEEVVDPEDPDAVTDKAASELGAKATSVGSLAKKSLASKTGTLDVDDDDDTADVSFSDSYTGSYNSNESWSTVFESVV